MPIGGAKNAFKEDGAMEISRSACTVLSPLYRCGRAWDKGGAGGFKAVGDCHRQVFKYNSNALC
eukprot:2237894-Ditylum_brightwellii.AAC.1